MASNSDIIRKIIDNLDNMNIDILYDILSILNPKSVYQDHAFCQIIDHNNNKTNCKFGLYESKNITRAQLLYNASVVDPSITLETSYNDKKLCDILQKSLPTTSWVERQNQYSKNLSTADRDILTDYTCKGDNVINSFLRGNIQTSVDILIRYAQNYNYLFSSVLGKGLKTSDISKKGLEFMKSMTYDTNDLLEKLFVEYDPRYVKKDVTIRGLSTVVDKINELIYNSPSVDKEFTVYRGGSDTKYIKIGTNTERGYVSTSTNIIIASMFANEEGLINIIKIPIGSHVLNLTTVSPYSGEDEILLPHKSKIDVYNCKSISFTVLKNDIHPPHNIGCTATWNAVTLCESKLVN